MSLAIEPTPRAHRIGDPGTTTNAGFTRNRIYSNHDYAAPNKQLIIPCRRRFRQRESALFLADRIANRQRLRNSGWRAAPVPDRRESAMTPETPVTHADLAVPAFLCERVRAGERAALLIVAAEEGSSPGASGFRMAVAADGAQRGTIGGGAVEYRMTREALAALASERAPRSVWPFAHRAKETQPDVLPSGMMCGGGQTVLLHLCDDADLPVLDAWVRQETGLLILDADGLHFEPGSVSEGPSFEECAGHWRYTEPVGQPLDAVYIIGGGHVGQALARQLSLLSLRVEIVDPRPELAAVLSGLPGVRHRAMPYVEAAAEIPDGDRQFVVIMTPGHASDYEALRAVVGKPLRYLAVLGSHNKAKVFRERLRADGVPDAQADRVRMPAGVAIGSRTPAEIAVSIAAEMIAVRRRAR